MNEMIQEAVLDSIESINEQQLFAEYEVLSSLTATYLKSFMIQEAATGLDFDGYEIVQEADEPGVDVKMKKNGTYKTKKEGVLARILRWIKDAAKAIRTALSTAFGKLFKRKGFAKYELATIQSNGGKLIPKTDKGREIVESINAGQIGMNNAGQIGMKSSTTEKAAKTPADYHNDYVSLNDVMVEFAISFPVRGLVVVAKKLEEIAGLYEKASQEYQSKDNTSHKTLGACQKAVGALKKMNVDSKSNASKTVPYPEIHDIWKESDASLRAIESRIDKARAYFDSYKDSVYDAQYQYNQAANPDKKAKYEANAQAKSFSNFISTAESIMTEVNKWLKKSGELKKAMDDCITKQRSAKKAAIDQSLADSDYSDAEDNFIPGAH